jgi:hypothetical protein
MAEQQFDIQVPEQGISEHLSKSDTLKFFDSELAFYSRLESVLNQNLQFGGNGLGSQIQTLNIAKNLCQSARQAVSNNQPAAIQAYVQKARSFELVIGQGKIGERVETLVKLGRNQQAQCGLYPVRLTPG